MLKHILNNARTGNKLFTVYCLLFKIGNLLLQCAFDASFQAMLLTCMRQMLTVFYTFNASSQAMFPVCLLQCLLFLIYFMPACKLCSTDTCYNACCFLCLWFQFASNALCTLASCYNACCFLFPLWQFASIAVCMDSYYATAGYRVYPLSAPKRIYSIWKVWALSQKERRNQQTSSPRLAVWGKSKNEHVANLQQ